MAGDVGPQRAAEVFAILKTFACPIVFVNGNWDDGGEAAPLRGRWLKSAHLRVVRVGELNFMGYSYTPSGASAAQLPRTAVVSIFANACW